MKKFTFTIKNPAGIHTRHAGLIVRTAKDYSGTVITITKDGRTVKASQLMKLIAMDIKQGDVVTVTAEGSLEETADAALKALFEENL